MYNKPDNFSFGIIPSFDQDLISPKFQYTNQSNLKRVNSNGALVKVNSGKHKVGIAQ